MRDEQLRQALFAALESDRTDRLSLAALADWFEEHDDVASAACLRWVVRFSRRPGVDRNQFVYGKYFWELADPHPIINDPSAQLPASLWNALGNHDQGGAVISFKSYHSAMLAYLALLEAWKASHAKCDPESA